MNLLQHDQQKWDRFEKQFSLIPLKYYFSASIQLSFNAFTVTFFCIKALLFCFIKFSFLLNEKYFCSHCNRKEPRLRRACAYAQSRQSHCCSHTCHNNMEDEEESDQNLDV